MEARARDEAAAFVSDSVHQAAGRAHPGAQSHASRVERARRCAMTGRQVLIASWGLVALVFAALFLDTYWLMRRDGYAGSVWKDGFAQFFLGGLSAALG